MQRPTSTMMMLYLISSVFLMASVSAFLPLTPHMTSLRFAAFSSTCTRPPSASSVVTLSAVSGSKHESLDSSSPKTDSSTNTNGTAGEYVPPLYNEILYEDYFDGLKPMSSWQLAASNFRRQFSTIGDQVKQSLGIAQGDIDPLRPPGALRISLSNEEVTKTERLRIEAGGKVDAHPVSQALYDLGCLFLDQLFDGRPIQRFWFLEVIARIPYFSYTSMLHLYESLGWWRSVELRKIHNAEEWNELHHLLIMESLGGNELWSDRFLGYHVAIVYYWFLNIVFLGSPRVAYEFMELLEAHAVDTYGTFVNLNRERLAELPAPTVARTYYKTGDLYLFDDFQITRPPGSRRPPCDTLLDVFENICQDEAEHVKTMQACQEYAVGGKAIRSPHAQVETAKAEAAAERKLWKKWSDEINDDPTEMSGY